MSAVYCDTSALYALLDRSDANAAQAAKAWHALSDESASLVTTNYVVLESVALIQSRLGLAAVNALGTLLDPFVTVHYVDAALSRRARASGLVIAARDQSGRLRELCFYAPTRATPGFRFRPALRRVRLRSDLIARPTRSTQRRTHERSARSGAVA